MTVQHTPVTYEHDGDTFDAVLAHDPSWTTPRPTVLVVHGLEGRSDFQVDFADRLVGLGYRGLAVDIFGAEVHAGGPARHEQEMHRFFRDREALRRRLRRIVEVAVALEDTDPDRVAAVGFCLGGLSVLDFARINAPLRAVACFHGILTAPDQNLAMLPKEPITAKVAVYHGWDDPYAPPEDVATLARELTARDADWQLHAYGGALHAFMSPTADNPEGGVAYDETTANRAWRSLEDFLAESLGG